MGTKKIHAWFFFIWDTHALIVMLLPRKAESVLQSPIYVEILRFQTEGRLYVSAMSLNKNDWGLKISMKLNKQNSFSSNV